MAAKWFMHLQRQFFVKLPCFQMYLWELWQLIGSLLISGINFTWIVKSYGEFKKIKCAYLWRQFYVKLSSFMVYWNRSRSEHSKSTFGTCQSQLEVDFSLASILRQIVKFYGDFKEFEMRAFHFYLWDLSELIGRWLISDINFTWNCQVLW